MEVLRAIFLTAYDSFDVKRWLLNFSELIWREMFSKLLKMTIRVYARENKRKVQEISDLTYFQVNDWQKKFTEEIQVISMSKQANALEYKYTNIQMYYNTKYRCINHIVLH